MLNRASPVESVRLGSVDASATTPAPRLAAHCPG